MNKVIAFTQYRENYGDEQNPYWKNKGGSAYVVAENVTDLTDPNLVPPEVAKRVVWSNPMSESYIIGMEVIKTEDILKKVKNLDLMATDRIITDAILDGNDYLQVVELDDTDTVLVLKREQS